MWNLSRVYQYSILSVMSCPVFTLTAKNRNMSFSHREVGLCCCNFCVSQQLPHQDSIPSLLVEGALFLLASYSSKWLDIVWLPGGGPHLELHLNWPQVADILSSFVSSTSLLVSRLMYIRISVQGDLFFLITALPGFLYTTCALSRTGTSSAY